MWEQLHRWVQAATWRHESGAALRIGRMDVDIGYASKQVSGFIKRDPRRYMAVKGSNTGSAPPASGLFCVCCSDKEKPLRSGRLSFLIG